MVFNIFNINYIKNYYHYLCLNKNNSTNTKLYLIVPKLANFIEKYKIKKIK